MSRSNSGRTGAFKLLLGSALTVSGLMAIGAANAQTPAPAPAPAAAPAAPAAPAKQKLVVTGLFDGYISYLASNPKHIGSGFTAGTPDYVFRNETPTLSLAELNLTYAPLSTGGFGYKATLIAGDTADVNVGNVPGGYGGNTNESRFKNIQQAYVSWGFSGGGGVDLGKFYTPFGYEVTESNANYNYTRSIPFTDLLPIYHGGLRITSPLIDKGLTLTGYAVNSINDTASEGICSDHNNVGWIGSANWTDPAGKYTFVETFGYSKDLNVFTPVGTDGGDEAATDETTLSDTDLTWNLDPKDTLGGNFTYRQDKVTGPSGTITSDGWALYARRQLNAPTAVALRYSGDDTKDGTVVGSPQTKPQEFTATYEIKSGSAWLTRLEYRHDSANVPLYLNGSGTVSAKSEDLVVLGEVYTFGG